MKKWFSTFLTLSFLISTPVWAEEHCNCSDSCREACADGKAADCGCDHKDCKDCGCEKESD